MLFARHSLQNNPKLGFTLIELMVVITITAILVATGYSAYSGSQKSARDARRKADIQAISSVLEQHINTKDNQNCLNSKASQYCPLQAAWFKENVIPKDPNGTNYTGLPTAASYDYSICAKLGSFTGTCSVSNSDCFCKTNLQ